VIRLLYPWVLAGLLLIPALILWRRRRRPPALPLPALADVPGMPRTLRARLAGLPSVLRLVALGLLVVALARPQSGEREIQVISEGIDIMLVLDTSGSMKAEDFKPNNRLYVAKEVAKQFISGRTGDRIGLVVFSARSFTQCPLTTDYPVLLNLIDHVDFGMIEDGTAIGLALANATGRVRGGPGKSKVVILLTDGRNNAGNIDPLTSADAAQALGVRVYTIGAGVEGEALYPVDDPVFGRRYVRMPSQVDDETLGEIARRTGGLYFRATDSEALARIYRKIDDLEKTKVETREYVRYSELGAMLAIPALILLLAEIALGATVFLKVP
jgi:Ca-activated chloride channel family protein